MLSAASIAAHPYHPDRACHRLVRDPHLDRRQSLVPVLPVHALHPLLHREGAGQGAPARDSSRPGGSRAAPHAASAYSFDQVLDDLGRAALAVLETVSKGFKAARNKLKGRTEITAEVVDDALRDIRVSLLEADVAYLAWESPAELEALRHWIVNVKFKGRLEPGRMFLIDFEQGALIPDQQLKEDFASRRPYADWLHEQRVILKDLQSEGIGAGLDEATLIERMQAVDTTIANVALPHMQGTMGATLVNISSGAQTKRSSLIEGALALVAFLALGSLIAWVPVAA